MPKNRSWLPATSSEHDLLLGADPVDARQLAHHVAVRVEAHGRVVAELLGDLHDRLRPAWMGSDANAWRRS